MHSKDEEKYLEALLDKALAADAAPDEALKRRTKELMREKMEMQKKAKFSPRRWSAVAAALLIMVTMSTLVYAAWQLLSPSQIAEDIGYAGLEEAFKRSEAQLLNTEIESAGYRFTLLGLISGEGLTAWAQEMEKEQATTYAVVATEKIGGKMPSTMDDDYESLLISPLVRGQKPWMVNIHTLGGGGAQTTVIDGVMYTIVECNSIEMFADRDVYLWITRGGIGEHSAALTFDEKTGEISRKQDYQDINALFTLPLDPNKADPVKVEQFLQELFGEKGEPRQEWHTTTPENDEYFIFTDGEGAFLVETESAEAVTEAAYIQAKPR